jgi:hypothetical protein
MVGKFYFNETIENLCQPIPQHEWHFEETNPTLEEANYLAPFVLADRGGCSFATKVENIEAAGGALGIVIDTSDEDIEKVVMTDDGTGAGIRIPSMLISKDDGEKLIKYLKTAPKAEINEIAITATFDITRPDNRVEYDIWMSSSDQKMLDFATEFMPIDMFLGDKVRMEPHYSFFKCPECSLEVTALDCFGMGKYCAKDLGGEIKGRDIIMENLRQMCLYKEAYNDDDNPVDRLKWWIYIYQYHQLCYGSVTEDCSILAHKSTLSETDGGKKTELQYEKTRKCV